MNLRGELFNPKHLAIRAFFNTGNGKMDTVTIKNLIALENSVAKRQ